MIPLAGADPGPICAVEKDLPRKDDLEVVGVRLPAEGGRRDVWKRIYVGMWRRCKNRFGENEPHWRLERAFRTFHRHSTAAATSRR